MLPLDSCLICLTDSGPSVQHLKRMPSAIYCPLIYSQIHSMDLCLSGTSYGRILSCLPTYQKKILKKWGDGFIHCLGFFFFFWVWLGRQGWSGEISIMQAYCGINSECTKPFFYPLILSSLFLQSMCLPKVVKMLSTVYPPKVPKVGLAHARTLVLKLLWNPAKMNSLLLRRKTGMFNVSHVILIFVLTLLTASMVEMMLKYWLSATAMTMKKAMAIKIQCQIRFVHAARWLLVLQTHLHQLKQQGLFLFSFYDFCFFNNSIT